MTSTNSPDLPIPAGAIADDWVIDYSGDGCRSLEWSRHDAAGIGVAVDGWQDLSGEVTRSVSLYDTECNEQTADGARQLARALIAAADELDALRTTSTCHPRLSDYAASWPTCGTATRATSGRRHCLGP